MVWCTDANSFQSRRRSDDEQKRCELTCDRTKRAVTYVQGKQHVCAFTLPIPPTRRCVSSYSVIWERTSVHHIHLDAAILAQSFTCPATGRPIVDRRHD